LETLAGPAPMPLIDAWGLATLGCRQTTGRAGAEREVGSGRAPQPEDR